MKITLSKSQWEIIGEKSGWIKTANIFEDEPHDIESNVESLPEKQQFEAQQEIDQKTGITKDEMAQYVRIQNGGRFNMLMDGMMVAKLIGITKDKYIELLNNYDRLITLWPDLEA